MVYIFIGPLNYYESGESQCATTCPETSKLPFVPGHTYEYSYASDVMTSIPGATEESSALHMTATVRLEALSACEMAISVSSKRKLNKYWNSMPFVAYMFVKKYLSMKRYVYNH